MSIAVTHVSRIALVAAALIVAAQSGCAFSRGDGDRVKFGLNPWRTADAVTSKTSNNNGVTSSDTSLSDSASDDDNLMFGSFSWEGFKKKVKKLTGRGENRDLARLQYREGYD